MQPVLGLNTEAKARDLLLEAGRLIGGGAGGRKTEHLDAALELATRRIREVL